MIKSGKSFAFHLALTDHSVLVGKSMPGAQGPTLVDYRVLSLHEPGHEQALQEFLGVKKGQYVQADCSVFPRSRFIRRLTLDSAAKAKDTAYLTELLNSTCKISSVENDFAIFHHNGAHLDTDKPSSKEIMFVGAARSELMTLQDRILAYGVFPKRLEIGTLPLLASVRKVAMAEMFKAPTLVLELGESQSHIYILSEGGVDMTRNISFGIESMLTQVKAELGLADEAVARKIVMANTFDFTEMAPALLRRLVKEIQASIGFYEVQTGFAIGQMFVANVSSRFEWITMHLARSIGLEVMNVSYDRWPAIVGIQVADTVRFGDADASLWNLLSITAKYE